MISVIVPVFNEEVMLKKKESFFEELSHKTELIFVDGGSSDSTIEYISRYGTVVQSPKGRAVQMNKGAEQASYDILLFLHADTYFPLNGLNLISQACHQKNFVGGCFSQVYENNNLLFRWIAFTGNVRAKVSKLFYGDQGIFVRKDIFQKLGGFPDIDICEDILFTKKLRDQGKVDILNSPMYCSIRRWQEQGILKTYWQNMRIKWALKRNGTLNRLAQGYQDVRNDV